MTAWIISCTLFDVWYALYVFYSIPRNYWECIFCQYFFLARRDECPESYCRTPGVGVGVGVGVRVYKNFNLAHNSWTNIGRAFIFHVYSLWQDLSMGTKIFDLVTLTLTFDLLLKNFYLGHNFLTRRGSAFIFHIYIPCDKTFPWVPKVLTLWPWPWSLTYFKKKL